MNVSPAFTFRPIRPADNVQVGRLIRSVMTEFECVGEGYSIEDPEVDTMYEAYSRSGAAFFVIENDEEEILGCGGIAPLAGDQTGEVCELKKMYFFPALRGQGQGRQLIVHCLGLARQWGYRRCYLETVGRMEQANCLYQKAGFVKLAGPMGATGHCNCEVWYAMEL